MSTLFNWDSGTLPTVSGSGVTLDTSNALGFGDSMLLTQVAAAACAARWGFTAVPQVAVRGYVKTPSAWPASSFNFVSILDAGLTSQMVRMNWGGSGSPGQARLLNSAGSTVVQSATGVFALSTVYRFELLASNTNDLARLAIFPLLSDSALYDTGDQAVTIASDIGNIAVGNFQTSPTVNPMNIDQIVGTDVYGFVGRDALDAAASPMQFSKVVTIG